VLNLTVAVMKTFLIHFLIPFGLIVTSWLQVVPGLYITTPSDGQIVVGTVEIRGSVPDDNFDYAEVSYAFSGGENVNWFPIKHLDQPVHDDVLAKWDTTTITDGVYRLKLSVQQKNREVQEIILEGIKVGNYTHYDVPATSTAASVIVSTEATLSATPTTAVTPEPTALPKNPANIDQSDIGLSLTSGLVLALIILGSLGVYTYLRQAARK
jgi:hypothetical protein